MKKSAMAPRNMSLRVVVRGTEPALGRPRMSDGLVVDVGSTAGTVVVGAVVGSAVGEAMPVAVGEGEPSAVAFIST